MSSKLTRLLRSMLTFDVDPVPESAVEATNAAGVAMPEFGAATETPTMLSVRHPDGRMSQYPPTDRWDDWVEWDAKACEEATHLYTDLGWQECPKEIKTSNGQFVSNTKGIAHTAPPPGSLDPRGGGYS